MHSTFSPTLVLLLVAQVASQLLNANLNPRANTLSLLERATCSSQLCRDGYVCCPDYPGSCCPVGVACGFQDSRVICLIECTDADEMCSFGGCCQGGAECNVVVQGCVPNSKPGASANNTLPASKTSSVTNNIPKVGLATSSVMIVTTTVTERLPVSPTPKSPSVARSSSQPSGQAASTAARLDSIATSSRLPIVVTLALLLWMLCET
jgi:hypothetical protein